MLRPVIVEVIDNGFDVFTLGTEFLNDRLHFFLGLLNIDIDHLEPLLLHKFKRQRCLLLIGDLGGLLGGNARFQHS